MAALVPLFSVHKMRRRQAIAVWQKSPSPGGGGVWVGGSEAKNKSVYPKAAFHFGLPE